MPIRIDRSTVDNDFWEEWQAEMDNSRERLLSSLTSAAAAAPDNTPPPPPSPVPQMPPIPQRSSPVPMSRSAEPSTDMPSALSAFPPPPTIEGVREQFLQRVAETRADFGRPLRELDNVDLIGSEPELISTLRIESEAMRKALLETVSEPWPEGSDEQIMSKMIRDAIEHAGSRVPSVELPHRRKRGREEPEEPKGRLSCYDVDGAESHEQLRQDIAAVKERDDAVRKQINALNDRIGAISEELKALGPEAFSNESVRNRRAGLLKILAGLEQLSVVFAKKSREYGHAAQDIFEATAIRWVLDFSGVAYKDGKSRCVEQRILCLAVGEEYTNWELTKTIPWDNVPNSVRVLLKNHGMDWCNSVTFEVFEERGSKLARRTDDAAPLSVGRTEALCLAIRPNDRRAGSDAPLGELRFVGPESQGYTYIPLHHGRKVTYDADVHMRSGRVHFTPETKRPYIMATARLVGKRAAAASAQ